MLYYRLNNRLEKRWGLLASQRIHLNATLSDDGAPADPALRQGGVGYLAIGIASAALFATAITIMTLGSRLDAGHIYSVMTYCGCL
jgi:hypothetical protein